MVQNFLKSKYISKINYAAVFPIVLSTSRKEVWKIRTLIKSYIKSDKGNLNPAAANKFAA
jgi:hypothetical protein